MPSTLSWATRARGGSRGTLAQLGEALLRGCSCVSRVRSVFGGTHRASLRKGQLAPHLGTRDAAVGEHEHGPRQGGLARSGGRIARGVRVACPTQCLARARECVAGRGAIGVAVESRELVCSRVDRRVGIARWHRSCCDRYG